MKNNLLGKIGEALKDEKYRRSMLGKLIYMIVLFSAVLLLYNVLFKGIVRDNIILDNDGGTEVAREDTRAPDVYDEIDVQEEKLQEILSKIKGVGEVDVMITYETDDQTATAFSGPKTIKVKGVIVVAQGAENVTIKNSIIQAVGAVFNIPVNRITVFEKN